MDAENCSCGKAMQDRTHEVAKCELYKAEPDVLEGEMRVVNLGGTKSFDALRPGSA